MFCVLIALFAYHRTNPPPSHLLTIVGHKQTVIARSIVRVDTSTDRRNTINYHDAVTVNRIYVRRLSRHNWFSIGARRRGGGWGVNIVTRAISAPSGHQINYPGPSADPGTRQFISKWIIPRGKPPRTFQCGARAYRLIGRAAAPSGSVEDFWGRSTGFYPW